MGCGISDCGGSDGCDSEWIGSEGYGLGWVGSNGGGSEVVVFGFSGGGEVTSGSGLEHDGFWEARARSWSWARVGEWGSEGSVLDERS